MSYYFLPIASSFKSFSDSLRVITSIYVEEVLLVMNIGLNLFWLFDLFDNFDRFRTLLILDWLSLKSALSYSI